MQDQVGRLLVVDDDPINRAVLTRALEQSGHAVSTAEDGRRALEILAADPPDVVLLDIVMPELDGFEVLGRMKSDHALRNVPVVMISGVDEVDSVAKAIEMGAEDFLPKPFDPVILRARVNAGLRRKRLHDLEQAQIRGVFSRFLPEAVVEEVLARADGEPRLGGERLEGTVMFTDLREFTTYAEHAQAEQVIEVLNLYLGTMGDAILDHGGTLVDYMGDGIMGVFGAPLPSNDHADRAVSAAREMLAERLPALNATLRAEGLSEGFRMGVGINTGPVMSGNVGSIRRLEYAVIGDTVNTASRIESLTKHTDHALLLADETRSRLSDPSDIVFVDEFDIRGRSSKVKLWTLVGDMTTREGIR